MLMISASCLAQFPRMGIPKNPAENYELKTSDGKAVMVIDAANGARILSLKWENNEVLSQNPAPNMYGSTFWTSPQKEWNWPPVYEHDMGKYSVEQKNGEIIMTSGLSERFPLRIRKRFSIRDKQFFSITYSITNEGKEARKVAPWEVTRVPGEGKIYFNAPVDSIWPSSLMNFKQEKNYAVFEIDKVDKQRKINVNGSPEKLGKKTKAFYQNMSYLMYSNKGLRLIKRFPDLKSGEAAPGEDEIQVYLHQNSMYCELEEQGAYTLLQPGESLNWTVIWQVLPEK